MIYNKKFIIGFLIFIALCIATLAVVVLTHKDTTQPPVTDTPSQTTSDAPLKIENFSSYEDINITTKSTIVDAIEHYISDTPHTSDPIGVIREGSYKKTTNGSITNIVFLVDIASLKRTYKIDFGTDSSTGQNTLYTLCPSTNELIYPPFNCKDDLSES
jgi:hypothetical protein